MLFVIILSVLLGIDSFVTCLSMGMCSNGSLKRSRAFLFFSVIGLFHFFMPIIGYFFATLFRDYISDYGKYLAGVIFAVIGVKMLIEGIRGEGNEIECEKPAYLSFGSMLVLSFMLSVDAAVAGLSASIIDLGISPILIPVFFSVFAFAMSAIGFYSGRCLTAVVGKYSEIVAGVLMLLLAVKVVTF